MTECVYGCTIYSMVWLKLNDSCTRSKHCTQLQRLMLVTLSLKEKVWFEGAWLEEVWSCIQSSDPPLQVDWCKVTSDLRMER